MDAEYILVSNGDYFENEPAARCRSVLAYEVDESYLK